MIKIFWILLKINMISGGRVRVGASDESVATTSVGKSESG